MGVFLIVLLAVAFGFVIGGEVRVDENPSSRSFRINHQTNKFEKDGKDFQYVSGSFHYFRAIPSVWQARLRTMRLAGLNTVDTYVEWATHNPKDNVYDFDGMADIEHFLTIAQNEELYVILRPGPYICAERDNGGIPYWLFNKYPNIKLRTKDSDYLKEVAIWYSVLMPKIKKFLYENGGPIIMVQVENEYGVSKICDKEYLNWLKIETEKYVENKAVLFTVDIPNSVEEMKCGQIEGVFGTTDFGIDKAHEMDSIWKMLRETQPTGPLVNTEFYPGWLTHWQEENQRRDPDLVADTLKRMLEAGASVNFYMFFGGTNFGFTAGANDWGIGKYMADITSYDYDAVMDESGNPNGQKYSKVRKVITDFFDLPPIVQPQIVQKMTLPSIELRPIANLLSETGRKYLGRSKLDSVNSDPKKSEKPLSFEQLNQFSGLVLYETTLPDLQIDPSQLKVSGLRDRALVYVDRTYVGTLSRENAIDTLPISAGIGNRLQIHVENQGRINFNVTNDFKGILGGVFIQLFNGTQKELTDWQMTSYPLTYYQHIKELIAKPEQIEINKGLLLNGPVVFHKEFEINQENILDTYIDPTGWGKGIIYVNGFNLGRYWPLVGPQITLYLPKDLLVRGKNTIVIIEYQKVPEGKTLKFTNTARLDGK